MTPYRPQNLVFLIFYSLVFSVFCTFGANQTCAQELLVTVSHTTDTGTHFWWKGSPYTPEDEELFERVTRSGFTFYDLVGQGKTSKMSKIVYGHAPLSEDSAKNLSKLFEVDAALTGNIIWKCGQKSAGLWQYACQTEGELSLVSRLRNDAFRMDARYYAVGNSQDEAKIRIYEAIELALKLARLRYFGETHQTPQTPQHTPERVVVLRGLQTADTLVLLRKTLRTQPGVSDVSEAWARLHDIAFEINPQQQDTPEHLDAVITSFLTTPIPNIELREVKRDEEMVIIEVLSY